MGGSSQSLKEGLKKLRMYENITSEQSSTLSVEVKSSLKIMFFKYCSKISQVLIYIKKLRKKIFEKIKYCLKTLFSRIITLYIHENQTHFQKRH